MGNTLVFNDYNIISIIEKLVSDNLSFFRYKTACIKYA